MLTTKQKYAATKLSQRIGSLTYYSANTANRMPKGGFHLDNHTLCRP